MAEVDANQAQLIEHLVGSTLSSIVKSQGLAASQLVEMIEKIGFESAPDGTRTARTFSFDFFRNELDEETNTISRRRVSAQVPLLSIINLPSIAIEEARINMDLRLVFHQPSESKDPDAPLRMFAVPAKKQVLHSAQGTTATDAAGTIKINVTMRQQTPLGLERIESLLDSAHEELIGPPEPIGISSQPAPITPSVDEPESEDKTESET